MSPRDAAPRSAHGDLGGSLLLRAESPSREPGEGRLPRYTWFDAYADLREKLDALGRRLGGEYRVLVDENDHVDREAAARSGVGFYGKNTMLITRRHGSWVVLGTLVTEAELETTPPLRSTAAPARCASRPARPAPSTSRARSTRPAASRTGARRPAPIPEEYRAELGAQVYGCDICQDVCPWNRGVEKRRAGEPLPAGAEPHVSLVEWLELSDDELRTRYERLYFPRKDPRYLRRNALVAVGNSGDPEHRAAVEAYAAGGDPLLREHAEWALARLDEGRRRVNRRAGASLAARALDLVDPARSRYPGRSLEVGAASRRLPLAAATRSSAWVTTAVLAVGAVVFFWLDRP